VPICFAFDGSVFYTAIDRKPKRVAPARLARMRHIKATPQVALVIDEYDEDWRQLWWILVRGEAKLMSKSDEKERAAAVRLLRAKYSQYASGMLPREALIIRITPKQITPWGKL
jgi:PPOX class probable F420-dependent enzyme